MSTELPWLEPAAFDHTPESFRTHAEGITRVLRGEARLWLGSHPRPRHIGKLSKTQAPDCNDSTASEQPATGACATCTCSKAAAVPDPDPTQITLVVPTSGSTGVPKSVAHSLQSIKASIHASAHFLGGHGAWLPLLPPTHIAGVQVIARAVLASDLYNVPDVDSLPGLLGPLPDLSHSFGPATVRAQLAAWDERDSHTIPDATDAHDGSAPSIPLFTSLVPTQLERLVNAADDDPQVAEDLQRFDAILVGGAAISAHLLERARAVGARIVTTYGSSETAGGCVYLGEPLRGTELKLNDEGRLMLTTPSLALGYLFETGAFVNITGNDDATRRQFFRMPELAKSRVFLTSDLAQLHADPATGETRLRILGRSDDVINSGGKKIVPQAVEVALNNTGEFSGTLVVPVPSDEWGEEAAGLIVPKVQGSRPTQTWRADLATSLTVATAITAAGLERHTIPRHLLTVSELPVLPSGKVDRKAGAKIAQKALATIAEFEAAKRTATFYEDGEHQHLEFGGPNEPDDPTERDSDDNEGDAR